MQNFPNNEIFEIMKLDGNGKCFDCLADNPTFTSTNNAVFLCENCANIHRKLGVNISVIKSLINDQFTPEEIALLKMGGNARFNNFLSEYLMKEEPNKVYKYHLKLAEYYRSLLLAEINKENNPTYYDNMINNKPGVDVGLQVMDTVSAENLKLVNQPQQSEFAKDVSNLTGKIGSFFSSISQKVNETAKKFGIPQKIDEARLKFNEGVKNFGENHPSIQNAATKTAEAFTAAKNKTAETLNKIIESPTVQNITGAVNNKYNEVINSETMKKIEQKTDETYRSFKGKYSKNENNHNVPQQGQNQEENNINNESQNQINQQPPYGQDQQQQP